MDVRLELIYRRRVGSRSSGMPGHVHDDSCSSKDWEAIAHCLRDELADYGGLLNLFEDQRRRASAADSETVLAFATRIEAQARLVAQSRRRRQHAVATFAGQRGRPPATPLREMLPLIEPDARPLLKALIAEVNILLHRVRRASRQTHLLLSRAAQVHQETLRHLRPHAAPPLGSSRPAFAVARG